MIFNLYKSYLCSKIVWNNANTKYYSHTFLVKVSTAAKKMNDSKIFIFFFPFSFMIATDFRI